MVRERVRIRQLPDGHPEKDPNRFSPWSIIKVIRGPKKIPRGVSRSERRLAKNWQPGQLSLFDGPNSASAVASRPMVIDSLFDLYAWGAEGKCCDAVPSR